MNEMNEMKKMIEMNEMKKMIEMKWNEMN